MARRPCAEPGCPTITDHTYCPEHARAKDKARGRRQERGYDAAYEQAKQAPEYVTATHCASCGAPFTADNTKTAGHSIPIRNGGRGSQVLPQCRQCNYGWRKTGL